MGTLDKSKHYDQEVQKIDEDKEELKTIIEAKNTELTFLPEQTLSPKAKKQGRPKNEYNVSSEELFNKIKLELKKELIKQSKKTKATRKDTFRVCMMRLVRNFPQVALLALNSKTDYKSSKFSDFEVAYKNSLNHFK